MRTLSLTLALLAGCARFGFLGPGDGGRAEEQAAAPGLDGRGDRLDRTAPEGGGELRDGRSDAPATPRDRAFDATSKPNDGAADGLSKPGDRAVDAYLPGADGSVDGRIADTNPALKCTSPAALCVFVTSTTYDGNLGGIAGADARCQARAAAAKLAGTYRAWIASTTSAPADRFTQVGGLLPYVMLDGQQIASSWADLTDKSLTVAFNRDEYGKATAGHAWSNTTWAGTVNSPIGSCENWTVIGAPWPESVGYAGDLAATNASWCNSGNYPCTSLFRLFCVQQ